MASMTPGCILSISSKMKTEEGQALTLPRIQFCSCSWNKRLKATEKQVLYWRYCKVLVCDRFWGHCQISVSHTHWLVNERGKKQAKGITQHMQINVQPQLEQQPPCKPMPPPLFLSSTPVSMAEHDSTWYGTSFWLTGVTCPGCAPSPSPSLAHPSLIGMSGKKQQALKICKHCCITAKTPLCSQHYQQFQP